VRQAQRQDRSSEAPNMQSEGESAAFLMSVRWPEFLRRSKRNLHPKDRT
jgi:hypothetical protein